LIIIHKMNGQRGRGVDRLFSSRQRYVNTRRQIPTNTKGVPIRVSRIVSFSSKANIKKHGRTVRCPGKSEKKWARKNCLYLGRKRIACHLRCKKTSMGHVISPRLLWPFSIPRTTPRYTDRFTRPAAIAPLQIRFCVQGQWPAIPEIFESFSFQNNEHPTTIRVIRKRPREYIKSPRGR